jgi:predicted nuclease of predicted toxin-antitoxin system
VRLLLDACVWAGAKTYLENRGHDVLWAGDWSEDPGDREILNRAHNEGRVLVTLDKDFGEIAILQGIPHSGILRLVDISATNQGPVCDKVISTYVTELVPGTIVTVEPGRVRIRPPDDRLS